jgi:sphingomyelin phosphodiesterase 2
MVLGLGDFNMVPLSLAHRLIEAHSPVRDVWRVVKPDSALGSSETAAEKARGRPVPTAEECLGEHGATCDSKFNTWRWSKQMQKELEKGRDSYVDPKTPDPKAKRLDYIFFSNNASHTGNDWRVESVEVGMTMRHPTLKVSLSDHFSIETTLTRQTDSNTRISPPMTSPLGVETYDTILAMISKYDWRERRQCTLRIGHFFFQTAISIGCFVAIWWSPRNYVSFILMFLSTLGFGVGVIDGLMGFLFVGSELRALREFEYEIKNARAQAVQAAQLGVP